MFWVFDVPLGANGGRVEKFVVSPLSAWFPHGGGVGDELGEIFIWRDHVGVNTALLIGAVSEGADDVVGLVARDFEHGDTHGFAKAFDVGDGNGELLGHGFALGFVGWVDFVPRCGFFGIKGNTDVGGIVVIDDIEERVGKSHDRRGIHALGGEDGIAEEGEVGTVNKSHAVEEEKLMHWGKC